MFQIEFDTHDIIIAESAFSESLVDDAPQLLGQWVLKRGTDGCGTGRRFPASAARSVLAGLAPGVLHLPLLASPRGRACSGPGRKAWPIAVRDASRARAVLRRPA